ncbi:FxSxx-COOH system tetratricopeptide repeat protein [Paractinoplanes durhamensis]|uniref:Cytochrome c n=1 Tax=Paractinoplanes durhamensis TaxID=113563 RepID=A0ABQ3Z041_9ACTN|nr:FxSxx-COOH system tetratricopeptide repeat protein [Actinoplanes durhamensis]GIE03199.1 cytochrome c [Actinoplanes durhamensis]
MTGRSFGVRPVAALPGPEQLADALRRFTSHATTLALVLDDSPSMRVWTPTVQAFQELAGTVFAEVNAYSLGPFRHSPEVPGPPDGQLVIVFSDGMAEFWAQASADRVLQAWGGAVPVAIVNPYPQERWHRSYLAPREVQLAASRVMSPNAELQIREPAERTNPFDDPLHEAAVVVPLLELGPRWLGWWASLLGGPAQGWLDAVAHIADPDRAPGPRRRSTTEPVPVGAGPRELVRRFQAEASASAFQLATYVASAPLELDALRIVQGALLPASQPVHLAEVVTSRLLIDDVGDLAFRPGVREELLARAAREDTVRVVEVVSAYLGERTPAARNLLRAIEAPDAQPDTPVTTETAESARLELAVLRALSGPYATRASRLEEAIARLGEVPEATRSGVPPPLPPTASRTPAAQRRGYPGPAAPTAINALLQPEGEVAVWGNLPPRNGDFTGREELLDVLDRHLRRQHVTAVLPQALHGMGGVGKSQIATEYAYRHRADYDVVWFVPSEQPAQILRALMELGQRLGLSTGQEANTAVAAVTAALQAGHPYASWLLIFDNAETLETVQPYLPTGGTGKVLVTSRNEQWTGVAVTLEIGVFAREESIALLRKRNPDLTAEEADRLAEVLDDLPLAIGQASAWRAATQAPVDEYLHLLAVKRAELGGRVGDPQYEVAVAAASAVALEHLGTVNPAALLLLQACAFMAPEPISRELFVGPRNVGLSPELGITLQKPNQLNRALREIERYGLARINHGEQQTVQLHRLVRTVVLDQLTAEQRVTMQHAAHLLLAGGNPGNPGGIAQWPRFHALLPHVLASDMVGCEDEWARQLVLDMIEFYFYWGDQNGCLELATQVVAQWTDMLRADDPQILKAARWLGFVLRQLGKFGEAARFNADCLAKLRAANGTEDEETLDAMSLVAADLRAAGDFGGALELDREAYHTADHVLGPDDPTTLTLAHGLGVSLRLNGDFPAALDRDMDTVRRRVEVLGADHPLTLLTQNGLTLDLRERGDYVEANRLQEKLYERIQKILGVDHPQTLMAARNLAVARRRAGYHGRARKLSLDTMNELRRRFGELNPEAIACALNYAVDLRENDQVPESRELADRTWQDYLHTLGPDHPYTLYARTNLGIVLRLLGLVDEAYLHDDAAHRGLRSRLGPRHVLTLTCATNLASDLAARGDHEAAHRLDSDTYRKSQELLGSDHPSTLACALNLAFDMDELGQRAEGRLMRAEVVASYRRVLGSEHPAIAAAEARQRANCDVDPMPL